MTQTILLVEDCENDAFFFTRAFTGVRPSLPISHVDNGRKALDYLAGNGRYADRKRFPIPTLVLMDLQLPGVPGLEVLRWIREESQVATLPVIILSASGLQSDVDRAYELGANAYLIKPTHLATYADLASLIKGFWLEANVAPRFSASASSRHATHYEASATVRPWADA